VTPEAAQGGPIALVEEGDTIEIDIPNRLLDIKVPGNVLARYQRYVGTASRGSILE